MITNLSATHCQHTFMFKLFKLLYLSYELTVKIPKDMASFRFFYSLFAIYLFTGWVTCYKQVHIRAIGSYTGRPKTLQ